MVGNSSDHPKVEAFDFGDLKFDKLPQPARKEVKRGGVWQLLLYTTAANLFLQQRRPRSFVVGRWARAAQRLLL